MNDTLERFFKLREHGTNVKTEILAGITTFLAMAYIIVVNPEVLQKAGMPFTSRWGVGSKTLLFINNTILILLLYSIL